MKVKKMHELNKACIEHYINQKTNETFTLDYDMVPTDDFSKSFSKFQKIRDCQVLSIWPLVHHDGRAVLVIEYDDPA